MVKPLEYVDHSAEADEKFLSQYKGSENFVSLVKILLSELTPLEDMYSTWTEKLDLDTATGVNLDYWRDILDSDLKPFQENPRPEDDNVFRSLLYALIGAYNSDGTARAIQQTLEQVLQADRVYIDDNLDGSFSFEVDNPTYIFGKELIANIVRIAKPVGVEFLGYTVTNAYGEPSFGFLEDTDENTLGFAVLASTQVTSGVWENYHCSGLGEIDTEERIITTIDDNLLKADFTIIQPKTYAEVDSSAGPVPYAPYVNVPLTCRITNNSSQPLSDFIMEVKLNGDKVVLSFEANESAGNWDVFGLPFYGNSAEHWSGLVEAIDANGVVWNFSSTPEDSTRIYRWQKEVWVEGAIIKKDGIELSDKNDAVVQFAQVTGSNGNIPATYSSQGDYFVYTIYEDDLHLYGFCYDALLNGTPFANQLIEGPGFASLEVGDTFTLPILNAISSVDANISYNTMMGGSTPTMTYNALNDGSGNFIWKQNYLFSNTDSYADFLTPNILYRSRNTVYVSGVGSGYLEFLYIDAVNTGQSQEVTCSGLRLCDSDGITVYEFEDGYEMDGYAGFNYPNTFFDMTTPPISGDALFTVKEFTETERNYMRLRVEDTATMNGLQYSVNSFTFNEAEETFLSTSASTSFDLNPIVISEDKDGEDFVDDIMNEFNGVIGAKVGFEYDFYDVPATPENPTELGQLSSFTFQSSGGFGKADGSAISAAIEPQVNNDFEDSKSMAFYGDQSFLSSFETDLKNTFTQGRVLRLFDKDNNRFELERLSSNDDLVFQPDNKYADTDNGLINTSLDLSYAFPSINSVASTGFGNILKIQPGFSMPNLSQVDPSYLEIDTKGDVARAEALVDQLNRFILHLDREITIHGMDGNTVRIVNKTTDPYIGSWATGTATYADKASLPSPTYGDLTIYYTEDDQQYWMVQDGAYLNLTRVQRTDTSGNVTGTVVKLMFKDGPKRNPTNPGAPGAITDSFYDIYLNGVLSTSSIIAGGTSVQPLLRYDSSYNNNYTAVYNAYNQNNPIKNGNVYLESEISNSQNTGFEGINQGLGVVIYDSPTDSTLFNCYYNGVKVSPASFLTLFNGYDKSDSTTFDSQNPSGLKVYDSVLPAAQSSDPKVIKYPYMFPRDQYNFYGTNESNLLKYDNGRFEFSMNLMDSDDILEKITDNFKDNIKIGNNISVVDKAGVTWKIQVPEGFVNENPDDDNNPYFTVSSNRFTAGGGSAATLDKQGAGYDGIKLSVTTDTSATPSSFFFDVYRDGVLVPVDVDTGRTQEPEWYFTPYGLDDKAIFEQNNPEGFIMDLQPQKRQWIVENLSTFDIVTTESHSDYWSVTINMSLAGTDNVALLQQNEPQVIMNLSSEQIAELNISAPNVIPYLIKETEEGDGIIPEEGYSIKGGGRYSILNQ